MKKLIAISVMIALVAGAAFAQTAVSGAFEARFWLIEANLSNDDAEATTRGLLHTGYVQLSGQNSEGTFGALIRLRAENMTDAASNRWHRAFAWWRPIPQLRIFLGMDPDGLFENAALAGWMFHQGNEEFIGFQPWDFWRGIFPGNWDGFGLAFTITPMPGFNINLIVPTSGYGDHLESCPRHTQAKVINRVNYDDLLASLRLNANFTIDGIGRVLFNYTGPRQDFGEIPDNEHFGDIGLSFLLTAVDGLQVQVGFSTFIPNDSDQSDFPLRLGLAAHYAASDWGLKTRFGTNITDAQTLVHGSVMPWYNFGNFRVNFDIGITLIAPDEGDSLFGFWLSPYLTVPAGAGTFQIGILLYNVAEGRTIADGNAGWRATQAVAEPDMKFAIPMRFVYSF